LKSLRQYLQIIPIFYSRNLHARMHASDVVENDSFAQKEIEQKWFKNGVRKLKIKKIGTLLWLVLTIAFPIRFTMKNKVKEGLS
jgi:hypothetical protein